MTASQEILDTIEKLRQERFPDVTADLARQIVSIEMDFTDNRTEAYRRISNAVDVYLAAVAATEAGD